MFLIACAQPEDKDKMRMKRWIIFFMATLRDVSHIDSNDQFLIKIGLNFLFKRSQVLAGQRLPGQNVHYDNLLISAMLYRCFSNDEIFFIHQKPFIPPAFF